MMTKESLEQEPLQAVLEKLYQAIDPQDPLYKIRAKSWERFLELGLPSRHDAFRYIRLRQLYLLACTPPTTPIVDKQQILPFIFPECHHSVIVFVNGTFNLELSSLEAIPKRIVICSLSEAAKTYGTFLNNRSSKTMMEEKDPFVTINGSLHGEGAFIYIPPKTTVESPIQVLHVIQEQAEQSLLMPRLNLFLGAQSKAELFSSQAVIEGHTPLINQVMDFAIEEGAHFRYTQMACKLDTNVWLFDATRASLKRDSTYKKVLITDGSLSVRHDDHVTLLGQNAEVELNGVAMLKGKQEAHVHVVVDHQAPHCRSMQLYKNVLNDASRSSFEGKILVRQAAQKTAAYQLNNNLLLNDKAYAYSKPNLEIFADDVKASHGSTVGNLDEEQLFYMKTRGFSAAQAQNLLVYGFCKEVMSQIQLPSLLKEVQKQAALYLK